jgi:alpha-tubulin suppressor-like RCC1 family protein
VRPGSGRPSATASRGLASAATALLLGAVAALALAVVAPQPAHANPAGQVYESGFNEHGELGDGTDDAHSYFALNPFLPPTVVQASPGGYASLELLANGTVDAAGYNYYGELGDGSLEDHFVPIQVPGLADVAAVSAGAFHSLALLANGTVDSWGDDYEGQLGDGRTVRSGCECEARPAPVEGVGGAGRLEGVAAIGAGYDQSYALLADGDVLAWGDGSSGQLGNGRSEHSDTPVEVSGVGGVGELGEVVSISAGDHDALALLANGHVVAWGSGKEGELGDGNYKESDVPVEVSGVGGVGKLEGVLAVSAGEDFNLALRANGEVVSWGRNEHGELGDPGIAESDVPVHVANLGGTGSLSGVTAISAGSEYALATTSSGTVDGWGRNYFGELGNEGDEEVNTPIAIPGLSGVFSLGHGVDDFDSLALEGAYASISSAGLDFGEQTDGTSSASQSVVLSNAGPAPLAVAGVVLAGSPGFVISASTCTGATLAAGASCGVSLAFEPGAPGPAAATLAFSTSAANALPTIALAGTGAAIVPARSAAKPTIRIDSSKLHAVKGKLHPKLTCMGAICTGTAKLTVAIERKGKPHAKRDDGKTRAKRDDGKTRAKRDEGKTRTGRNERETHAKRGDGKAHARRRTFVLGKGSYSLAAGATGTVTLELTAKGKRYLARLAKRHHYDGKLTIVLKGGSPASKKVQIS